VLEAVEGIEFVRFGGEDVVRHKLVQRIVEAYDAHTQRDLPDRAEIGGAAEGGGRRAIRSA
jgi:phosphate starvation-inducible PhoH-like protein